MKSRLKLPGLIASLIDIPSRLYFYLRLRSLCKRLAGKHPLIGFGINTGEKSDLTHHSTSPTTILQIRAKLEELGVKTVDLHTEAAASLYRSDFWRDGVVQTEKGIADLVVVGQLRMAKPVNLDCVRFLINLEGYAANGAVVRIPALNWSNDEFSVSTDPKSLEQRIYRTGLLAILDALVSMLENPPARPNFCYDTTAWPFGSGKGEAVPA